MVSSRISSACCLNHTAYKDGKPFCYKLIKDLKGIKENAQNDNNKPKSVRYRYCKADGHVISDCPKLLKRKSNEDSGLNHLSIGNINSDILHDDSNSKFNLKSEAKTDCCVFNFNAGSFVDVPAGSVASMHVWPSDRVGSIIKTAKMANGCSCEINDIRDVYIVDELGTKICLRSAHSLKGVEKHIISINVLRKDGWKLMDNGNVKFAYLGKENCRITFIEKENNFHYLQTMEVRVGVNNVAINTPGIKRSW